MTPIKELITKLSNASGISGSEEFVLDIVRNELSPYVDEFQTDVLGNLIAIKHGTKPSIMIAAHADEIGLMVKHIDDKGFISFVGIGGWFSQTLLSQRVILHTDNGPIIGVVGSKPPHIMEQSELDKVIKIDAMFIDVGCTSKDEVISLGINIGTPISLDRNLAFLRNKNVTGKSLDNRAGLVAMIEAIKRTTSDHEIYAVATVQEEVGLKGARVAAFGLNPDFAIATDVTISGDHPGVTTKEAPAEINKGPAIIVADASGRGIITKKNVLNHIIKIANDHEIPYQLEVSDGGVTDGMVIYLTKAGIPTCVISIPTRYIHSPIEVLNLNDLEKTSELIAKILESPFVTDPNEI